MRKKSAFTLIELLIVVAVIAVLSAVVLTNLNNAHKRSRDARRLSDMRLTQEALEMYFEKNEQYPDSSDPTTTWDTPAYGGFIPQLVSESLLNKSLTDPLPSATGNYRYYRYAAGEHGCDKAKGHYYVLEILDLETTGNPAPNSPGWACSGYNWQSDGDWVTGKYEH